MAPYSTGSSIIAIKYKNGVMIAGDTLVSYGSMARFKNMKRVFALNNDIIIGYSGDEADFEAVKESLDELLESDYLVNDNHYRNAKDLFNLVGALFYQKRSKMEPFWNSIFIGGFDRENKPFLGSCDIYGTAIQDDYLASGMGRSVALPFIRERHSNDLSEEEASNMLMEALKLCYYRDCRASQDIAIAKVSKDGALVSDIIQLRCNWDQTNELIIE